MSKGLSKEDLEQDILIEYSSRFMFFYEKNKVAVISSGIGILAAIGLLIGYFVYMNQQESQAEVLLGVAEESMLRGDYETALYGDESEYTIGFAQISNNFGRTNAGNLASYYAAVSEFELGNYDEALRHIRNYSVPSGILGVSPISLHATILSELERYEEAGDTFERAARWNKNTSTTPYNLYEAALAYREAGLNQRAVPLIEEILADYSNSPQASKAQRLQGMLSRASN